MGTFMSNKSHASNLLKYNAVDDKASALLSTGHGGKPNHNHIKEIEAIEPRTGGNSQINPSKFNSRSNPNDPRTGTESTAYQKRHAINAAAHKKLTGGTPQSRAAERARRAANRN